MKHALILTVLFLGLLVLSTHGQVGTRRGTKKPTGSLGRQQRSRVVRRPTPSGVPSRPPPADLHEDGSSDEDPSAAVPAATCDATSRSNRYTQVDLWPLRMMWNSSDGFCGETSIQMIALTRGVWVSQRQARMLGTGDVSDDTIFDGRNDNTGLYFLLSKRLAFDQPPSSYWDKANQTLSLGPSRKTGTVQPGPNEFMSWVKRNIIAGRPVITAVRVYTEQPDSWYDHIVPFFGVCTLGTKLTATLSSTDTFTTTSDYTDEVRRPLNDPHFFAEWEECPYDDLQGQVGCIASDAYNFGVAMGELAAPASLYKPSQLVIRGWSNGISAQEEPGEDSEAVGNSAMASYKLTVTHLTRNRTYTTYRLQGPLTGYKLPQTAAELAAVCQARGNAGCRSRAFRAVSTHITVNHAQLGKFPANSIQYFLTVDSTNKAGQAMLPQGPRTTAGADLGDGAADTVDLETDSAAAAEDGTGQ